MAQAKIANGPIGTNGEKPTVAEMHDWYLKNKSKLEKFESASNALNKRLRDVTKSGNGNIAAINKEELKRYIKQIASNEFGLRKVVRYLYYRSNILYRLINWYSDMWDLRCRKVTPVINFSKDYDESKIMKSYYETLNVLDLMNLQGNMTEVLIRCYREDVSYNAVMYDDTGMFFFALNPDECKIDGRYLTGDFSFSMDMSKWKNAQRQQLIEWIGEPFRSMYQEHLTTKAKWIHMPDEYAACFKFRTDDYEKVIPPFLPLLLQIANIEDLIDQQAVADELNVFKLLVQRLKVLSGSNDPDNFEVTPDISLDYADRIINELLPSYINYCVIPGSEELQVIDFKDSVTNDVNRVQMATDQILSTAGGGAVINTNKITSTAAFNAWLKAETEFAMSTLLPQVNGFCNRFLSYKLSNPCRVDHFEVSVYTKDDLAKQLLESNQHGYFNRIAYSTLLGISEREFLAQEILEGRILKLQDKMIYPLSSSYTQSGDKGEVGSGAPVKDDSLLSPEGERSRNR